MAKNRIFPKPKIIDLRIQQTMAKNLCDAMRVTAVDLNFTVSGQALVEGYGEKFNVLFSVFPNGDFMCWFLNKGYFSIMALVNQKQRHIATFPAEETENFEKMMRMLQKELGA